MGMLGSVWAFALVNQQLRLLRKSRAPGVGKVEPRRAVFVGGGLKVWLLDQLTPPMTLDDTKEAKRLAIQSQALKKLTPQEKKALGF